MSIEDFDIIDLGDNTNLIIGESKTTYKFLQNLNVYKANLYKHNLTFKPLRRIDEQIVLVKVVSR